MSYGSQSHLKIKTQNQTANSNLNRSKAAIRKEEINIPTSTQDIHMSQKQYSMNQLQASTPTNVNNFNSRMSGKPRGKNISIGNLTMNTNNFNVTGNSIIINKKDPLNVLSPKTKDELMNLQLNTEQYVYLRPNEPKKKEKESNSKTFVGDKDGTLLEKENILFDYQRKSNANNNISESRQNNKLSSFLAYKSNVNTSKIQDGLNISGVPKSSISNYPSPKPLYNKIISQLKSQFKEITSKHNSKIEDTEPFSECEEKLEGLEMLNKISSTNPPSSHAKMSGEARNDMNMKVNMKMLKGMNTSNKPNSQMRNNLITSTVTPASNTLTNSNSYICQTENEHETGQPSDIQRILTQPEKTIKASNSKKISSKRNAGLSASIISTNTANNSVIALNKSTVITSTENVPDEVFFADPRYIKLQAQISSEKEENERKRIECEELKTMISVLKEFAKAHQTVFERASKAKIIALAHEEMKRLLQRESMERDVVFQQNRELKLLVLKLYYQIQRFEEEDIRAFKENHRHMSQLLKENEYLRWITENCIVNGNSEASSKKIKSTDSKAAAHKRNDTKVMESKLNISVIDEQNKSSHKSTDKDKNCPGSSLFSTTLSEMSKTIKKNQSALHTTMNDRNTNFTKNTASHKLRICYNKKKV